ncbi:MAG: cation:proton antiporter [Candidatus Woesearchaeota archaeon]
MDVVLVLVICLVFSYIISYLFRRIGLPHMLGHMLTGLIISFPVFKNFLFKEANTQNAFSILANLGLIFLLFFIGLKINVHHLLKFSKKSINISMLSALMPFLFGFVFGHIFGLGLLVSIVLGACLSVTAEAVSTAVLRELGMINSRTGLIIIEAGIIDDIFELLILAVVGAMISKSDVGISSSGTLSGLSGIFLDVVIFVGVIYIVRFIFIPIIFKLLEKEPSKSELFTASFIIVLAMAAVANYLQLGTVIGALVAGVIVKQTLIKEHKRKEEIQVVDMVESVTFGFLEPVFFIWIAYQADIFSNFITSKDFLFFAGTLTVIATAGKILGSVIGNLTARDKESIYSNIKEGVAIGWGMNARGAVELIAIKIASDYGIVNQTIYSAVVLMAFVTTIMSPLIFKASMHWLAVEKHIKSESKETKNLLTNESEPAEIEAPRKNISQKIN